MRIYKKKREREEKNKNRNIKRTGHSKIKMSDYYLCIQFL